MPSGFPLSIPSPCRAGYDVADFTGVDLRFGTLEDLDRLLTALDQASCCFPLTSIERASMPPAGYGSALTGGVVLRMGRLRH